MMGSHPTWVRAWHQLSQQLTEPVLVSQESAPELLLLGVTAEQHTLSRTVGRILQEILHPHLVASAVPVAPKAGGKTQ